jgi:transposase
MIKKRKQISDSLKAKIAIEAIKENMTLTELSQKFGIHSTQIMRYKKQALESMPEIFSKSADRVAKDIDKEKDELYKHIGQLKVELDWLKKKSGLEY